MRLSRRTADQRDHGWYALTKRGVDLAVGLALAPPAAVVTAAAAGVGLVVQGRPVLFVQERVGRDGAPFGLVKLRTMRGEVAAGRSYQERDRITRYGTVLRTLKVDEVPQVLNLLRGDISLVGPRPLLAGHVELAGGGGRRHSVRPGLTCLAQLELAELGYLDRFRQVALDEEYVDRAGPALDTAILVRTGLAVLGLARVYRRRHPTLARWEPHLAGVRPFQATRVLGTGATARRRSVGPGR